MTEYRQGKPRIKCYRQQNRVLTVIGGVLIAAGLLLLFLCIPGWAWAALVGTVLVAGGVLLIRMANRG